MTLNEYQMAAARTLAVAPPEGRALAVAVLALGLAGEAGEVADLLKKHLGHGHTLDRETLRDELGDCLWYLAGLASTHGMTLDDIARANVEKLERRYPGGFSHEASRARADLDGLARREAQP